MRIVDVLKPRNTLFADPGAPDDQRQARREWLAARTAQAIISKWDEVPRSRLVFGRYWIEDESTGCFYREFGGDPGYAQNVVAYYTRSDGTPVMLEPDDPPNRAELARRQSAKAKRKADKAAATKALYKERREAMP